MPGSQQSPAAPPPAAGAGLALENLPHGDPGSRFTTAPGAEVSSVQLEPLHAQLLALGSAVTAKVLALSSWELRQL